MLVELCSGRKMEIPGHHTVFKPVGDYKEGEAVDPVTVVFECEKAVIALKGGTPIIVDNVVEVVKQVWCQQCEHRHTCDVANQKVVLKNEQGLAVLGPPCPTPYRREVRSPADRQGGYREPCE